MPYCWHFPGCTACHMPKALKGVMNRAAILKREQDTPSMLNEFSYIIQPVRVSIHLTISSSPPPSFFFPFSCIKMNLTTLRCEKLTRWTCIQSKHLITVGPPGLKSIHKTNKTNKKGQFIPFSNKLEKKKINKTNIQFCSCFYLSFILPFINLYSKSNS